jgi:hypothetical protein
MAQVKTVLCVTVYISQAKMCEGSDFSFFM